VIYIEKVSEVQATILRELLIDGRKSEQAIAATTGLSKETVRKNYRKMKKMGIITGATTHINYKSFGYKAVAQMLINVDFSQTDQLIKYLQNMPNIYSVSSRGVKGNINVVAILQTLEQLNDVKDSIKRKFSVLELKTAIWTDVKEMNYNLAITENNRKELVVPTYPAPKPMEKSSSSIDKIDQKIADILAENGRISMTSLAQDIGVSPSNAKKRYEKMRNDGSLKVTIQVNPNKIGYHALCVFFTVTSAEESTKIIEKISRIPDIISIMKTTGDYDLEIYAMVQDLDRLLSIQEELGKIRGITKIDVELLRFDERWTKWPTPKQYISTF
jgi:Lrp/AsnC family leucine-responsive transcriptional regulator